MAKVLYICASTVPTEATSTTSILPAATNSVSPTETVIAVPRGNYKFLNAIDCVCVYV